MNTQNISTKVEILPAASKYARRKVIATMTNGDVVNVFSFYDDELQFTSEELTGLTIDAMQELRTQRDIAYLRS